MADERLTKLLEELHTALTGTEAVDEKGRELLRALNADISNLLEQTKSEDSSDSLLDRLQDTIDHFEVTHPALTSVLSNMLTALSNAGI